jgi:hypothetical protein
VMRVGHDEEIVSDQSSLTKDSPILVLRDEVCESRSSGREVEGLNFPVRSILHARNKVDGRISLQLA